MGSELIDRIGKWRQLGNDVSTKLRLLYLECRRNLALLSTLHLGDDAREVPQDDPDYRAVIPHLETEVLELAFFEGRENEGFFKVLEETLKPGEETALKDMDDAATRGSRTLLHEAVALYVSVTTLRKLAALPGKGQASREIQFKTRLRNIRASLRAIVASLGAHRDIEPLRTR